MAETVLPVGVYITKKGYALITKLLAANGTLEFTKAAVGTGKPASGTDPSQMIALASYKADAEISKYGVEGDQAYVTAQVSSDGVTEGFLVTEIGVFANDPDEGEILYAYMDISGDPTYIYAESTSAMLKFTEFTIYVLIGDLKKVTAVITPNSFVSKEELDKQIDRIDALETKVSGQETSVIMLTLSRSGWTAGNGFFTQQVNNTKIKESGTYQIVSALAYDADQAAVKTYQKAFGIVMGGMAKPVNGGVIFKVWKKPETDITVGVLGDAGDGK